MKKKIIAALALLLSLSLLAACGAKPAETEPADTPAETAPAETTPAEPEKPAEPEPAEAYDFTGYYADPDPDAGHSLLILSGEDGYDVTMRIVNAANLSGTAEAAGGTLTATLENENMDKPMTVEITPVEGNGGFLQAVITDSSWAILPTGETFTFAPYVNPAETAAERFSGQWTDETAQRAVLTVVPAGDGLYEILLHWSDGAASFVQWEMTSSYDLDRDALVYEDGARSYVTLHETGPEDVERQWSGSVGAFWLEDGKLCGADDKEEDNEGIRFERISIYAPDAEYLLDRCLRPIAAGADAAAACDVLRFADAFSVWCCDREELRANLAEAWAGLSESEQKAFAENVEQVSLLIFTAADNWSACEKQFEDAGVREEMQALAASSAARLSWQRLDEAIGEMLLDR